jgi:hypothetical protein
MIKKIAGGYQARFREGQKLGGPYETPEDAKKRLRRVEFFKHREP